MAEVDEKELVLVPNEYAYILDKTKGNITTYSGPIKTSLAGTDQPVSFDEREKRFKYTSITSGTNRSIIAPKGFYVILKNPARDGQPTSGKAETLTANTLQIGQKVNLPGPQCFPLWPGQMAKVVKGHILKSNQYLQVRVYDEDAAKENWSSGVVKLAEQPQSPVAPALDDKEKDKEKDKVKAEKRDDKKVVTSAFGIDLESMITGQLIVIKGTEVSFFIPPTGIEVLQDGNTYVRDAVTLERLEYCILLDEDGNKRYVHGPEVVFPRPTENFIVIEGKHKFKAYDLNEHAGLYLKVIADYEDEKTGTKYNAGDELFITGKDQAIYYPRPEHAIIKYGDQEKHYAIAIPTGESRYVLDRDKGNVFLVDGPAMFLPDPRTQVVVRRILDDKSCQLYYPNNADALQHNRWLRQQQVDKTVDYAPVTASALIADEDSYLESYKGIARRGFASSADLLGSAGKGAFKDQLNRGTSYTPPRTIVLDTKYEGAISINVWTGYAIQIVNKAGDRKIVTGPKTVVLAYDEYLEPMNLSTGRPKTSDNTITTAYLRTINNRVGDKITVETKDMVKVSIDLQYLVKFIGEPEKWFAFDNYVQYLSHHLRSIIINEVRQYQIREFYEKSTEILRDLILKSGEEREGMLFENNMHLYDVEVLDVQILNDAVARLLNNDHQKSISDAITLDAKARELVVVSKTEEINRQISSESAETKQLADSIAEADAKRRRARETADISHRNDIEMGAIKLSKSIAEIVAQQNAIELESEIAEHDEEIRHAAALLEHTLATMEADANAVVKKGGVISKELTAALTAMAQTGTLQSLARHLAPLSIVKGQSLAGTLGTLVKGTPLAALMDNINDLSINGAGVETVTGTVLDQH